jgi:POT family proton-dependent oligopeptide transporter
MLVERGLAPQMVTEQALPIGEAFQKLVEHTGQSPEALTQLLYINHQVGLTWFFFAAVGVLSALMIYFYGRWILTLARKEQTGAGARI